MKVLLVNKFFFRKGGAESVFFATADLLRSKGHEVRFFSMSHENNYPSADEKYFVSKVDYDSGGARDKAGAAARLMYSFEAKRKMEALLADFEPDVAHLHNIYHQISPSILHVLKRHHVPVVMTLHDYKMVCPSYSMLSQGKVCEKCREGRYFYCLREKCMKGSGPKSLLCTCEMYLHHRVLKVYDAVDSFISPSRFLIEKMGEMGFRKRIAYLPNFVDTAVPEPTAGGDSGAVLYLGRLSGEKGLSTLVTAVKGIGGMALRIVGDGPERTSLERRIAEEKIGNVKLLGHKTGDALKDEIDRCLFGIIPSECYENNPMSVLELFAAGKPVVGSRIGGIPELIADGERGLLFEPGNADDLRARIVDMLENSDGRLLMGHTARAYAERELGREAHYERLTGIYRWVLARTGAV